MYIFPEDTIHYVYVPRRSFSSGFILYKSWERVIVVSRRFFLAMKMSDKKSHRASKIATYSIGKRNACLFAALYHLNKIQCTTFLRNANEKLIRCIYECVFNTLKNNVSLERCEKNQLTKYKKTLRRVVAKHGRIKESCWCSEMDFYFILSGLYYRPYYH